SERGESEGANDDAGDEIGDDRRQSDLAGDRHAHDRGREQHQAEREETEFAVLLFHADIRAYRLLAARLSAPVSLTWIVGARARDRGCSDVDSDQACAAKVWAH